MIIIGKTVSPNEFALSWMVEQVFKWPDDLPVANLFLVDFYDTPKETVTLFLTQVTGVSMHTSC
jgi:hypothetical protein